MPLRRLLLVEDDNSYRALLHKFLSDRGFEVDESADGWAAIRTLSTRPTYEALIIDLMIPTLNGFAIIDFVKQEHPELLDKVILITAVPRETVMRMAPELGSRLLIKPFPLQQLLDCIEALQPAEGP